MICTIERSAEFRALFYRLLASGFRYPNQYLILTLSDQAYWHGLSELLQAVGASSTALELLEQKEDIVKEAKDGIIAIEIEYNRLFQLSQNIACPLTACEYLPGESRQATAVAQLRGLYRAFGLQTRPNTDSDNLSVLLEFMAFVCAKEANAKQKNEAEHVQQCIQVQKLLLEDFLGWLPIFHSAVKLNAQLKFYPWLAALLVEFLRQERSILLKMDKEKA